jgi:hypothetical protein
VQVPTSPVTQFGYAEALVQPFASLLAERPVAPALFVHDDGAGTPATPGPPLPAFRDTSAPPLVVIAEFAENRPMLAPPPVPPPPPAPPGPPHPDVPGPPQEVVFADVVKQMSSTESFSQSTPQIGQAPAPPAVPLSPVAPALPEPPVPGEYPALE